MNNWGIPGWLEEEVLGRDLCCVYCGIEFDKSKISKKNSATWEHIVNDAKIITRENIALCCCSCNASKGAKKLADWIASSYCQKKNITFENIAPIARKAMNKL